MADPSPSEQAPKALSATSESAPSKEVPFSLLWLNATDPRTFTPRTWESGRATTIRLRAADDSVRVNVERIVSRYPKDDTIRLKDEVYSLGPGESEAGSHEISQFRYTFDADGALTNFDPTPTLSEHMQAVVRGLSGLVHMAGSTIYASNPEGGQESNFVSDGTQWVDAYTGMTASILPAIGVGQLTLGPSTAGTIKPPLTKQI